MTSNETHHIVLLPGFFSFGEFGQVRYFDRAVRRTLERAFEQHGSRARVVEVDTQPTASIRHRAARALELIADVCREHQGPVHLVGHSTGGLDARLAITPTAALPTSVEDDVYERVASLVTVSTPHFGTPLASLFGGVMGQRLVDVAAAAFEFALRRGKHPIRAAVKVGSWIARADDFIGLDRTPLDEFYAGFLNDFGQEAEREILEFLSALRKDQSLVFQLTDAGCDLLNAATGDPSRIRYGSIVTQGARPRLSNVRTAGRDVYAQFLHHLYFWLHLSNSRAQLNWLPEPSASQAKALVADLRHVPERSDNDGVVPCWSQIWGDVIAATRADHLDVVGHYGGKSQTASDWLPSYSGFSRLEFERVWTRCARFLLGESDAELADPRRLGKERARQQPVFAKRLTANS